MHFLKVPGCQDLISPVLYKQKEIECSRNGQTEILTGLSGVRNVCGCQGVDGSALTELKIISTQMTSYRCQHSTGI